MQEFLLEFPGFAEFDVRGFPEVYEGDLDVSLLWRKLLPLVHEDHSGPIPLTSTTIFCRQGPGLVTNSFLFC